MTARRTALALAAIAVACAISNLSAAGADTRLIDAVKRGDLQGVRALVQRKASVSGTEADGTTALHWAARGNQVEITRALVKAGAPVNAATRYGVTPLALASEMGSLPIVELLVGAGANVNAANPDGESVLMVAARTGRIEVVDRLIAAGADVNAADTWRGETALMRAAAENHAAVVTRLAKAKAKLDQPATTLTYPNIREDFSTMVFTAIPKGGFTPLMFAAREGAIDAAGALAEAGANLDVADPDGTSALVIAIINAHYDLAALLLDKGAKPNIADSAGMAALYAAVDMLHQESLINRPLAKPSGTLRGMDIIARLLDHGADPNQALKTPLLMRLHNFGDAALGEGATPLMRAAKVSDVALMRRLLDKGADAKRAMKNGTTALMVAVNRPGRGAGPVQATIAAATLLLERGADVNAATANGDTALHIAVGKGDELVKLLAEKGAKLDAKDRFNRTPLDIANGVAGGGRGRGGAPPEPPPTYQATAALLKQLMAAQAQGPATR
jgi:ankyrin repeat protein